MNKREDTLHLKLYITMIFCVIIAIFITSSILYVNFQTILMKHEYKANIEKMEGESSQINKLSDIALSTVFQIYNDISVKKLLTYNEIDAVEESAAFIQLRSFLVTIPYVDSIYVYNIKNNRIYIVTNENELKRPFNDDYYKKNSDFYDRSAVEMIENCTNYLPYIPVPRFYRVNDNYNKCVYTYMMYNTFSSQRSNVVMLNLEAGYLFQEETKDDLKSTSLVLDQNNSVIYTNTDKFQVQQQFQQVIDFKGMDKDKSGYFVKEIGGTKSVVIYTGADKHQWRYVSIIEYDALLSQVRKMQTITILISLLITFICGLAAHLYSRRLTVPVRTMSMNIKNLQDEKRRSELITRNRKLLDILHNGGIDQEGRTITGLEFLSQLGLEFLEGHKLVILSIQLDGDKSVHETYHTQDINTLKFAAVNILSELLGDKIKSYDLDHGIDRSLIFMNAEGNVSKEILELNIKKLQSNMKEYFSIAVSVIASIPEEDPDHLYYLYERIEEATSRSIFWGEGYLTFVPEPELKSVNDYEYPEQKEKHLAECLMLGKADAAQKIYDDIIAETYQYPIIIYNMVINRIIFTVNNVVNLIQKNSTLHTFGGFTILSNILQDFDTLEIRNNKLKEIFLQIQKELENRKSEKQDQTIIKINQLIDRGFEDPNFSLDLLADSIGMSTAHMCRVYKQYTGNTIIDILGEKRMDQARKLLIDTNLSINEIAEKVGYINASYFYRVFKKANGVTPNEYRKK
jgi:two-component system, response regulator YesN